MLYIRARNLSHGEGDIFKVSILSSVKSYLPETLCRGHFKGQSYKVP